MLWFMSNLAEEITSAQRLVKTDAHQMSVGEIVSMYENGEFTIDPEFRLPASVPYGDRGAGFSRRFAV